tara:strand:+ start:501 stop:905 length:405 start_codon:yes stop_codon:yes gene_type:complete
MIEEMNRESAKALSAKVKEVLEELAQKEGLQLRPIRSVSYDPQGGEVSFKVELCLPPQQGRTPVQWTSYCHRFDLLKSDFGRTFKSRDGKREFLIVGLRPRATKRAIVCAHNGKEYLLSPSYVRAQLEESANVR